LADSELAAGAHLGAAEGHPCGDLLRLGYAMKGQLALKVHPVEILAALGYRWIRGFERSFLEP